MSDSDAAVAIQPDDNLDEVLSRLREGGARGKAMTLVIPASSSLFLTATEFRALKSSVDRGRFSVTIRTSDTLRLQLARMLGLEAAPLETRPAPRPSPAVATAPLQPAAAPPDSPAPLRPVVPVPSPVPTQEERPPGDDAEAVATEPSSTAEPVLSAVVTSEEAAPQSPLESSPVEDEEASAPEAQDDPSTDGETIAADGRESVWPDPPADEVRALPARTKTTLIDGLTGRWSRFRSAPLPTEALAGRVDATPEAELNDEGEGAAATSPLAMGGAHWQRLRQAPMVAKVQTLSPRSPPVLAAAAIGILLIAAVGLFLLIPRAEVTITLAREPVRAAIIADVSSGELDPEGGALAVSAIPASVEVEYEGEIPTTGTRSIPDEIASSELLLRNATAAPITIEVGTTVTTEEGVEFVFDEEVTVPGVDSATGEVGAASAIVRAVEPGAAGNVETGAIGGQLPSGVYYSNREGPAHGGSDRTVAVVAPGDVEALAATAEAELRTSAEAEFADQLDGEAVAIAASVSIEAGPNRYSHEVGEDAETLRLETTRDVTALTYDPDVALREANRAVREQLSAAAPDGYVVDPTSITIAEPELVTEREDGVQLRLEAKAVARAVLDDDEQRQLVSRLAGRDDDEAVDVLNDIPEVEAFEIDYQPGVFRNRMPGNGDRITLTER